MTKPDKPKGYTVGKWKSIDNYVCDHCPYATTTLASMVEHQAKVHRDPASPRRVVTPPKVDRFDNPVVDPDVPSGTANETASDAPDGDAGEQKSSGSGGPGSTPAPTTNSDTKKGKVSDGAKD